MTELIQAPLLCGGRLCHVENYVNAYFATRSGVLMAYSRRLEFAFVMDNDGTADAAVAALDHASIHLDYNFCRCLGKQFCPVCRNLTKLPNIATNVNALEQRD